MSTRPPISYIIPAYNYAHLLGAAVDSICAGNLQADDEIIIVNDASTDNTAEVMRSLASRIPQVKLLTHRHNKGCSLAGVNTAIENARHDLFFGLAADNLLVPDSMDALVTFMQDKKADVAAFQEVRFFTDATTKPTHSWFFKEETSLADALTGYEWPGPDGHHLWTRECWLRAGRCDEFFRGLDSWAFGIRLLATGSKMVALPGTYYLHRWGHESLWRREGFDRGISVRALRVMLPILHLLEQESVDYIFSPEGRDCWFENLAKRPLRVRSEALGSVGQLVKYPRQKEPFLRRLRKHLAYRIAPQ